MFVPVCQKYVFYILVGIINDDTSLDATDDASIFFFQFHNFIVILLNHQHYRTQCQLNSLPRIQMETLRTVSLLLVSSYV